LQETLWRLRKTKPEQKETSLVPAAFVIACIVFNVKAGQSFGKNIQRVCIPIVVSTVAILK
jgi:hypothetical protein